MYYKSERGMKVKVNYYDYSSKNAKISLVAKCFGLYLFLTWFQTSQESTGTIIALLTILLTIVVAFLSGQVNLRRFYVSTLNCSVIVFLAILLMSSIYVGNIQAQLKTIVQMLLFIVATNIYLTDNEMSFIKKMFIVSSTTFSALVILGCTVLGVNRYYHGTIVIFGTQLNPNHIGITLVAGAVALYYLLLHNKKRIITVIAFVTSIVAVFFTASKSNYLSLIIVITLITIHFMNSRGHTILKKILACLVIILLGYMLVSQIQQYLPMQWERMTNISIEDDNGRSALWAYALDGFKTNPLFGHGIGSMYIDYGKAAHNTFFELLYELGLLGVVPYITLFISLIIKQFKTEDKTLLFILIAIAIKLFFMSSLDDRGVWGLLCWAAIQTKENKRDLELTEVCYDDSYNEESN